MAASHTGNDCQILITFPT